MEKVKMILGIDPGLKGALAFFDPETRRLVTYAMPVEERSNGKRYLLAGEIVRIIQTHQGLQTHLKVPLGLQTHPTPIPLQAFLEDVYSSPQMGVTSAFTFGEGKGTLVGILTTLAVPIHYVSPTRWKGKLKLTADKTVTKAFARALFPTCSKSTLSTEGKCEAALIAQYGSLVIAG